MANIVALIGKTAITAGQTAKGVGQLLLNTLWWVVIGPFKGKISGRESIFEQMVFAGVQSLGIVCFISLFTGIVIAMQSAYQLKALGAVIFVSPMVSISIARELGPVFTAFIVAGRV
ncbi:MAG: ABC transporter permease, partial [Candidatus Omnitrophica bacterium]|nr:ABC transporter permease [Candidatus Omnitrophota bacterium]